jgi:hypothetical protein
LRLCQGVGSGGAVSVVRHWRQLRSRRSLLHTFGSLRALTCVQHELSWDQAAAREEYKRGQRCAARCLLACASMTWHRDVRDVEAALAAGCGRVLALLGRLAPPRARLSPPLRVNATREGGAAVELAVEDAAHVVTADVAVHALEARVAVIENSLVELSSGGCGAALVCNCLCPCRVPRACRARVTAWSLLWRTRVRCADVVGPREPSVSASQHAG